MQGPEGLPALSHLPLNLPVAADPAPLNRITSAATVATDNIASAFGNVPKSPALSEAFSDSKTNKTNRSTASSSSNSTITPHQSTAYHFESIFKVHFKELGKALMTSGYLFEATFQSRGSTRKKLAAMKNDHLLALSADVYDDLQRRKKSNAPFLPWNDRYYPKRNEARRKIGNLPSSRFELLAGDLFAELGRRYPKFPRDLPLAYWPDEWHRSAISTSQSFNGPYQDLQLEITAVHSGPIESSKTPHSDDIARLKPGDLIDIEDVIDPPTTMENIGLAAVGTARGELWEDVAGKQRQEGTKKDLAGKSTQKSLLAVKQRLPSPIQMNPKATGPLPRASHLSESEGDGSERSSELSHRSDISRFASDGDISSAASSLGLQGTGTSPDSDLADRDLYIYRGQDLTGAITKVEMVPFECGAVADLYRGEIKDSKRHVAIKILRGMHTGRYGLALTTHRSLYQAANDWTTLNHENVLAFWGIALDLGPSPALISPLCPTGPVMKYLQRNTITFGEKLEIIRGVVKGMSYLHAAGIVHGNLSTSKILIDNSGVPVIASYGMFTVLGEPGQTTGMLSSVVRFTAPECYAVNDEPSTGRHTPGDVYSLSMVILEICTGFVPYHDRSSDHAVLFDIVRGARPKLSSFDNVVLPTGLRILMQRMWTQIPSTRPDIEVVLQSFLTLEGTGLESHLSVDQNIELYETENETHGENDKDEKESSSSGEEASFAELSKMNNINVVDLSRRVRRDGDFPFAGGGNSNVYRGKMLKSNGKKIRVAIKMIRLSDDGSGTLKEIIRKLKREASIWSQLNHPNLLPFIGICHDIAPWPVLVSPFYKHGHILKYLLNYRNADRMQMIVSIALGLEYLHSKDIVHGDLKAQNILVDKQGNPTICDFGISKVIGSKGFTTASVGTAPYMAPELFFVLESTKPQRMVSPKTTKHSDVYSFGLLVLEILTGEAPKSRPGRPIISSQEYFGLFPERSDYPSNIISYQLWDSCLIHCWKFDPEKRPSIQKIIAGNHFSPSV
ncbi:kinase-like domain-containing protein [Mycena floridula]|nr:kinase-like domain-containing protein [Mycena floridula]